ncbi:hypothetical protein GCM10009870_010 [Leucobacter celer subsp. celer]
MQRKTGYVWHERFAWHDTGTHAGLIPSGEYVQPYRNFENPESKSRLAGLIEVSGLIDSLVRIPVRPVSEEDLARVHTPAHIERIRTQSDAGGGAVVSVTSDLSRQPEDSITDYAASKAAVASVAKSLARLYAPTIRVNCVAPGPIYTPFWSDEKYGWQKTVEGAYGKEGTAALDALIEDRGIPMARMGTPEEVGAAVAFLASEVSGFTTGATLGVDGGSIRALF